MTEVAVLVDLCYMEVVLAPAWRVEREAVEAAAVAAARAAVAAMVAVVAAAAA